MAINPATGVEDPNYVDLNAIPSATTGAFQSDPITMATGAGGAADTGGAASTMSSLINPQNVGLGATLLSGMQGSQAIKDANSTLQAGLTTAEGTVADFAKPYTTTGAAANQQLATGLQTGGQFNTPFTMDMAKNKPAMQTALTQGMNAIQNSAAAKGGLLGTNSLAALSDYGQQTGAQYENQAFNQYMQENAQAMGGLENLSGTGATTATAAGGNIANLQASGAQAGMNATLGAVNNQNQTIANAIAAYKSLAPTATTTGGGAAGGGGGNPVTDIIKAITSGGGAGGTQSGVPAGSVIDPTTGQAATTTPDQINNGTVKPTQTVDPAQAGAINAQNQNMGTPNAGPAAPTMGTPNQGPQQTAPAPATQTGGATTAPVSQGQTQTTELPAQATQAVSNGTPVSQDLTAFNQSAAQAAGIVPNNSTGSAIGDYSPLTGALIVPDMLTGLPIDSLTGIPALPVSSFDQFFSGVTTPLDTGNMGLGVTDPLAEFLSTPALDLGGLGAGMDLSSLNLNPTGVGTGMDWLTSVAPPPDLTIPMSSGVDPYDTPIDTSYLF